jgi:hypothetical protein
VAANFDPETCVGRSPADHLTHIDPTHGRCSENTCLADTRAKEGRAARAIRRAGRTQKGPAIRRMPLSTVDSTRARPSSRFGR